MAQKAASESQSVQVQDLLASIRQSLASSCSLTPELWGKQRQLVSMVQAGESTGCPVTDFAIIHDPIYWPGHEKSLLELKDLVSRNLGQLFFVTCRAKLNPFELNKRGLSSSSNVQELWILGVLSDNALVFACDQGFCLFPTNMVALVTSDQDTVGICSVDAGIRLGADLLIVGRETKLDTKDLDLTQWPDGSLLVCEIVVGDTEVIQWFARRGPKTLFTLSAMTKGIDQSYDHLIMPIWQQLVAEQERQAEVVRKRHELHRMSQLTLIQLLKYQINELEEGISAKLSNICVAGIGDLPLAKARRKLEELRASLERAQQDMNSLLFHPHR